MRVSLQRFLFRCAVALVLFAGGAAQLNPTTTHTKAKKPAKAAEELPAAPQDVYVGAYLMRIHQINIHENYFTADFYLWFRWKGADIKPYKTFSLVDARQETRQEPAVSDLADGSHYAYVRVVAQITKFWDLRQYPLDSHDLDLNVEEEEDETNILRYVADEQNSGADANMPAMPGWKLLKSVPSTQTAVYHSNFGDDTLPTGQETRYSRFTLRTELARQGVLVFFKLLYGVWTGAGIAFVAFFIAPNRIDPRFGVGVGAIFAAIASEYIVTQSLPDTNVMTLADKIHVLAFSLIFASIAESTLSLYLHEKGHAGISKRMDHVCRLVFPVAFVLLNALIIHYR